MSVAYGNRKKKKNGYAMFVMRLHIIVLVLVGDERSHGCETAVAYEDSQPTNTMDSVVASEQDLLERRHGRHYRVMPHEAQTDEECAEIIKSMIGAGVSYKRKMGATDTTVTYNLVCDTGVFGSVTLVEDTASGTKYEGLYPWKLEPRALISRGFTPPSR